jgi:hypothetical protein
MSNSKVSKTWIAALLLAVAMAGCGDPDSSKVAPPPSLTPPTVVSVVPAGGTTGVCQGVVVTATFSKAMNPATIIQSPETTFTLAAGAAGVPGTVSLDSTDTIATFTPMNPLALNTQYTATITTAAKDQFGNGLAADFTWTFKTATTACPAPIAFGTPGCGAGILAGQAITNTGPSTVSGDLDISPLTSITGFGPGPGMLGPGIFTGMEHIADSTAASAQNQLTTVFTTAMSLPPGTSLPPDIGGLPRVFPPGVYTTIAQPSLGITGDLTLDPVGDPNATWIFQIASTLTTASGKVILLPPGKPGNVFWAIGTSATLGTGTTMEGNVMTGASITMNAGATLNGRALARSAGAVTIGSSTINVPPCPGP